MEGGGGGKRRKRRGVGWERGRGEGWEGEMKDGRGEHLSALSLFQKFPALSFCVFIQFYSALTQLKVICKCTWLSCDSVHGFNVEIW